MQLVDEDLTQPKSASTHSAIVAVRLGGTAKLLWLQRSGRSPVKLRLGVLTAAILTRGCVTCLRCAYRDFREERTMEYDLKITGGWIVDGSGAPRRRGDVALAGGRIAAVGSAPVERARRSDARGSGRRAGIHRHPHTTTHSSCRTACSCRPGTA